MSIFQMRQAYKEKRTNAKNATTTNDMDSSDECDCIVFMASLVALLVGDNKKKLGIHMEVC